MAIDYKKFSDGSGVLAEEAVFIKQWWACPVEQRAEAVSGIIHLIKQYDTKRQSQYTLDEQMYGNTNLSSVNGQRYSQQSGQKLTIRDRVTYNVVQAGIDTIVAKMSKNRPKPLFLTSGGDYKMQRKARKLDKFVDGVFYENDAYMLGGDGFRDACIRGDGLIHVFNHEDRVKFERVNPREIYVDPVEAYYGFPRQMHRAKNIDRDVVMQLWPKHKALIEQCDPAFTDISGQGENVSDQITVVESWHLRSGKDAKDGLHSINIDAGNIEDERWDEDVFPLPECRGVKRPTAFGVRALLNKGNLFSLRLIKFFGSFNAQCILPVASRFFLRTGARFPRSI